MKKTEPKISLEKLKDDVAYLMKEDIRDYAYFERRIDLWRDHFVKRNEELTSALFWQSVGSILVSIAVVAVVVAPYAWALLHPYL